MSGESLFILEAGCAPDQRAAMDIAAHKGENKGREFMCCPKSQGDLLDLHEDAERLQQEAETTKDSMLGAQPMPKKSAGDPAFIGVQGRGSAGTRGDSRFGSLENTEVGGFQQGLRR